MTWSWCEQAMERAGRSVGRKPAPDFTSELVEPALTKGERLALDRQGFFAEPSAYSA